MEIILGVLVTAITQIIKVIFKKVGGTWSVIIVFALGLVGSAIFYYGKAFMPGEFLETWSKIMAYQYLVWGFLVKYVWPQIMKEDE